MMVMEAVVGVIDDAGGSVDSVFDGKFMLVCGGGGVRGEVVVVLVVEVVFVVVVVLVVISC